ncbi:MAG: DNA polymerase III subunit delta' [Lachnospiraceae bacterium]|nr:DNA polymerase III subunit delta' [Lachnospiraceae bacterium]
MNQSYDDILGENDLKNYFRTAVASGKVGHAYIISGEKGSGRHMLAEAFAAALLCDSPKEGQACMSCPSCRKFSHHSHPDLVEVLHEKPNVISVDEVRSQLVNVIATGPLEARYKVYLIADAEKMNPAAQNAILKTIEEPPTFAVILLLTDNKNAFLPTILSRCICLETKPVREDLIERYLMRNYGQTDYTAAVGAAFAQGNLGRAIDLVSSEEFHDRREFVVRLMDKLMRGTDYEFEEEIKTLKEEKDHIDDILNLITIWFRDVLLYKATGSDEFLIFTSERSLIRKQALKASYSYLEKAFRAIRDARNKLRAHVNFELTTGLLILQLKEIQNG